MLVELRGDQKQPSSEQEIGQKEKQKNKKTPLGTRNSQPGHGLLETWKPGEACQDSEVKAGEAPVQRQALQTLISPDFCCFVFIVVALAFINAFTHKLRTTKLHKMTQWRPTDLL